jgi:hypothetical protein
MRFPNDTAFHMKMAALVIVSLFVEHNAPRWLPDWSAPQIGVITFVLGLAWVTLFAAHRAQATDDRVRVLEEKLERTTQLAETLADERRERRALPPM